MMVGTRRAALGKYLNWPLQMTIGGVLYERLIGADGNYLSGASWRPVYGRIS